MVMKTRFKKPKAYCSPLYTKNNILCLYTFHFKLWHNFLGADPPLLISYLFYKRKLLES